MILIRYPRILEKWDMNLIMPFLDILFIIPKELREYLVLYYK
jgi:hypothetical protein